MATILDDHFIDTKGVVKKDARGRVALGPEATDALFSVSRNRHGQYLLTPVVQIPAHEAWLWNNKDALDSVQRGLEDAKSGRIHDMGSFAQFADLDIED